jgi:hypothetical protein
VAGEAHLYARALGYAAEDVQTFELDPQLQTVHAQVAVKFTITEPTV